jgi:hypothetical protein
MGVLPRRRHDLDGLLVALRRGHGIQDGGAAFDVRRYDPIEREQARPALTVMEDPALAAVSRA